MPRVRPSMLLLVALLACGDDCSCGLEDLFGDSPAEPPTDGAKSGDPLKPNAIHPDAFDPAPDSPEVRRLAEIQKGLLEKPTEHGAPVTVRVLQGVVPDVIGDFQPMADPAVGESTMFGKPVRTVARKYQAGERRAYVKLTDTSLAPELRGPFAQKLTVVGNEHAGGQHGTFISGHPAVVAHYPEHRSTTVTMLVAGRFLIDVRVKPSDGAEDAARLAAELALDTLEKGPEGTAGQGG